MTELYPKDEMQRLKKRVCLLTWLVRFIGAAALIVCIVCCIRVSTLHALRLQWTAVFTSTLAGWIILLLQSLVIAPTKALWQHAEGMMNSEPEIYTGVLTMHSTAFQIPHSILVRKVQLDGDESLTLNIADCKASVLPANGTCVRVRVVRRYITACEVCHEDD